MAGFGVAKRWERRRSEGERRRREGKRRREEEERRRGGERKGRQEKTRGKGIKSEIDAFEDVRLNVEGKAEERGEDARQLDWGIPTWGVSCIGGSS